jgi:TonB family protein
MIRNALIVTVFSLTAAIVPAQQAPVEVKEAHAPHYPPIAVLARVVGQVEVRVNIGSDGVVLSSEYESGPRMLQTPSTDAAKKWKFEADTGSNRVSILRFSYALLDEKAPDEEQTIFLPPDEIVVKHRPAAGNVQY